VKNKMDYSIGLVIPTINSGLLLDKVLEPLEKSLLKFQLLIIDSSSTDKTVNIAKEYNAKIIVIPQSDFNHGATREYARQQLKTDFIIYLTQDAIPINSDLISHLIKPLIEKSNIAVSYGRQIAHDNADIFESFPREFNYNEKSHCRGIEDIKQYGVYTFFCSNSCAAYRNSALDEIGGFKSTLTNEDYFAVAELLQKEYKIAYVAEAVVKHSHRYTLWQEFQRYFDTGYVRAENPIIQQLVGQAETRGKAFVRLFFKKIIQEKPLLLPYAIIQTAVKWLGYRAGFYGQHLPLCLIKKLSQQSYFWSSKYYNKK